MFYIEAYIFNVTHVLDFRLGRDNKIEILLCLVLIKEPIHNYIHTIKDFIDAYPSPLSSSTLYSHTIKTDQNLHDHLHTIDFTFTSLINYLHMLLFSLFIFFTPPIANHHHLHSRSRAIQDIKSKRRWDLTQTHKISRSKIFYSIRKNTHAQKEFFDVLHLVFLLPVLECQDKMD